MSCELVFILTLLGSGTWGLSNYPNTQFVLDEALCHSGHALVPVRVVHHPRMVKKAMVLDTKDYSGLLQSTIGVLNNIDTVVKEVKDKEDLVHIGNMLAVGEESTPNTIDKACSKRQGFVPFAPKTYEDMDVFLELLRYTAKESPLATKVTLCVKFRIVNEVPMSLDGKTTFPQVGYEKKPDDEIIAGYPCITGYFTVGQGPRTMTSVKAHAPHSDGKATICVQNDFVITHKDFVKSELSGRKSFLEKAYNAVMALAESGKSTKFTDGMIANTTPLRVPPKVSLAFRLLKGFSKVFLKSGLLPNDLQQVLSYADTVVQFARNFGQAGTRFSLPTLAHNSDRNAATITNVYEPLANTEQSGDFVTQGIVGYKEMDPTPEVTYHIVSRSKNGFLLHDRYLTRRNDLVFVSREIPIYSDCFVHDHNLTVCENKDFDLTEGVQHCAKVLLGLALGDPFDACELEPLKTNTLTDVGCANYKGFLNLVSSAMINRTCLNDFKNSVVLEPGSYQILSNCKVSLGTQSTGYEDSPWESDMVKFFTKFPEDELGGLFNNWEIILTVSLLSAALGFTCMGILIWKRRRVCSRCYDDGGYVRPNTSRPRLRYNRGDRKKDADQNQRLTVRMSGLGGATLV